MKRCMYKVSKMCKDRIKWCYSLAFTNKHDDMYIRSIHVYSIHTLNIFKFYILYFCGEKSLKIQS